MIHKHTSPKMSKKDFLTTIFESEKEVETPVKPDVKPERPRPSTPYQPKHKPAPKAKDLPDWLDFNSIGLDLK